MISELLDLLRVSVGPTFAVVAVFEGVRRLTRNGMHRQAAIWLGLGIAFFCAYAAFGFVAHTLQNKTLRLAKPLTVPELPESWGADFSIEVRVRNSLHIARAAFMENGRLQKHFIEPGTWVMYAPTQQEIADREQMIRSIEEVRWYQQTTEWLPIRWLIIATISALLGVVCGLARESANKALQSDVPRPAGSGRA